MLVYINYTYKPTTKCLTRLYCIYIYYFYTELWPMTLCYVKMQSVSPCTLLRYCGYNTDDECESIFGDVWISDYIHGCLPNLLMPGTWAVSFTKYARGSWIPKSLSSLLKWNYQTTSFNQHRSPGQPIWECLGLSEGGCVIYIDLAKKWTYICVSIGQGNFVFVCITTAVSMYGVSPLIVK